MLLYDAALVVAAQLTASLHQAGMAVQAGSLVVFSGALLHTVVNVLRRSQRVMLSCSRNISNDGAQDTGEYTDTQ